jgi:hypothetical protein
MQIKGLDVVASVPRHNGGYQVVLFVEPVAGDTFVSCFVPTLDAPEWENGFYTSNEQAALRNMWKRAGWGLPEVREDSSTTLPEDEFVMRADKDGAGDVIVHVPCENMVCWMDPGDDLNTLVRLSYAHREECTAK